jgi:flagellar operon protein
MNDGINVIIPGRPLSPSVPVSRPATGKENKTGFEQVLQKEIAGGRELKFSAHAEKRLRERKIVLAIEDLARIEQAFKQVEAKGARESLIIYGDLALITSVKNKTIVTAVDGKALNNHVFTNIDSAVIVR